MATMTYATGRHPQGSARSAGGLASSKRVRLLIPGSAGDAAPARRRVAGYLYAINATPAEPARDRRSGSRTRLAEQQYDLLVEGQCLNEAADMAVIQRSASEALLDGMRWATSTPPTRPQRTHAGRRRDPSLSAHVSSKILYSVQCLVTYVSQRQPARAHVGRGIENADHSLLETVSRPRRPRRRPRRRV